jgi:hypothetical protein
MKTIKHVSRNAGVALAGLGLSLFAGLASAGPWVTEIPEPSVISLMVGGIAALVILKRLRRKK